MFFDDVKSRRSVRTFDGKGLTAEVIEDLENYSKTTTNPYNIPITYTFLDAKEHGLSSPVLSGERCYVTAKIKKEKNADVAYGYSFEDFLMYAVSKNLGTVWIGGTMPRDKFEKASNLAEDEIMPCISPLGVPAEKMGVKEVLMRKGVKADSRFDFSDLFFKDSFDTPLSENDAKNIGIYSALEAVRFAPSAVNKQPWRAVVTESAIHFFEKKDRGYDNGVYDLQKVDVGIAMYHFERECKENGVNVSFTLSNPNISLPENTEYIASYTLV
ncbi:hypothetical protein SAMN02910384_02796 [Pseudobutyrivibrio sp. ACV-2]|uniref:nitroreductase family protein n=1 Tax=Pseudobutyrivibrio sp. ACV-2 TaxID=1520801 RepID=UPI000899B534|nr:nitroreductase family protein [Pseudobutyrivibrio sp. ACV-2]SEA93887.1 hypothetical protein SAMN02910384_02796 [Pseudobutyrivibrio sp. ACV-2]